jgi:hypothetical protein
LKPLRANLSFTAKIKNVKERQRQRPETASFRGKEVGAEKRGKNYQAKKRLIGVPTYTEHGKPD